MSIITARSLSKRYRLGTLNASTLRDEIQSLWQRWRHGGQADADRVRDREDDFWALRDVSFDIQEGDVVGIIGGNGAGKSTLLKVLSRITEPTSGEARIRGRVASLLEVGTGFHPELSGRENIFLNGTILGMSKGEVRAKFDEIVDFSGVDKFIDTPVKRYSSGMYVRLAFAVAAHLEPEIMIVDEVLAVGDTEFQKKCIDKMKRVATHGRTVLFVSHNLLSIRSLCNRGLVMAGGELTFMGTAADAITFYSATNAIDPAITLADRPRTGNGAAKAVCARLRMANGAYTSSVASGDDFTIVVDYETQDASQLKSVVFSIALKDDYEAYCFLVRSTFEGVTLDMTRGTRLECHIEDFALAPGKYRAVLFISLRDNDIIDYVDNAFEMTVTPGHFFANGNPGLPNLCKVLTKAQWNVSHAG